MNVTAIPSIILFSLSIPIVMNYRIWPIEGTPYILFGILFFALIGKVMIDLYPSLFGLRNRNISLELLVLVLIITLGGSTLTAIVDRHRIAPVWGAHDIVLQLEAAMRYLTEGKNPYKETYFGTPVESFRYDELGKPAVNPALYHFVMPPWYLLSPFPVYWIANKIFGYFDVRMISLIVIVATSILLWRWIQFPVLKELSVILIALSPATVSYFIEGRSDSFALVWLLASLFFLQKRNICLSAILMGLGLMSKQTIWFAFPIWGAYLFFTIAKKRVGIESFINSKSIFAIIVAGITALFIMLPFLVWDATSIVNSTILYLSAGGETGYPISGYGFSMMLYEYGIVKGIKDYFPFILFQLGLGLPVLIGLLYWIKRKSTISRFFLSYGIFLFIIWYFSRYFNNSHIAFLSNIFVLGVLFHYDEQLSTQK